MRFELPANTMTADTPLSYCRATVGATARSATRLGAKTESPATAVLDTRNLPFS